MPIPAAVCARDVTQEMVGHHSSVPTSEMPLVHTGSLQAAAATPNNMPFVYRNGLSPLSHATNSSDLQQQDDRHGLLLGMKQP